MPRAPKAATFMAKDVQPGQVLVTSHIQRGKGIVPESSAVVEVRPHEDPRRVVIVTADGVHHIARTNEEMEIEP